MSGGAQFALQLSEFAQRTQANMDLVVRKVTVDLLARVVLRSPVDTGRFRSNWQVTVGAPAGGTLSTDDKTGGETIARGDQVMLNYRVGPDVFIVNNLPYGPRLEYEGWSKQAPNGMVRITVSEFQQAIDKALQGLPQ